MIAAEYTPSSSYCHIPRFQLPEPKTGHHHGKRVGHFQHQELASRADCGCGGSCITSEGQRSSRRCGCGWKSFRPKRRSVRRPWKGPTRMFPERRRAKRNGICTQEMTLIRSRMLTRAQRSCRTSRRICQIAKQRLRKRGCEWGRGRRYHSVPRMGETLTRQVLCTRFMGES